MHWIIDGMNVIGSHPDGWWKDRQRAMGELVERLERWAAALPAGDAVTVVFEKEPVPPIVASQVVIAFAPHAKQDSADDEIVRLVCANDSKTEINVVTSDGRLAKRVMAAGAAIHSAGGFRRRIATAT